MMYRIRYYSCLAAKAIEKEESLLLAAFSPPLQWVRSGVAEKLEEVARSEIL